MLICRISVFQVSLSSSVPKPTIASYAHVSPMVSVPAATSASLLPGNVPQLSGMAPPLLSNPPLFPTSAPLIPSAVNSALTQTLQSSGVPSIPPLSFPAGTTPLQLPNLPPNLTIPPLNLPSLSQISSAPGFTMPSLTTLPSTFTQANIAPIPVAGQTPLPSLDNVNAALPKINPVPPVFPEPAPEQPAVRQNGEA